MIKLIVEGQQLDLFKNEVFAISKSIAKIGDINLRHGDVSINFKVPSTAKNNLIFRYISNLNNNNIGAFKRFEGVVLDGQSVISRGYYQVLKTKPLAKEIELRFYGGNSDWFDLIKDRSINKTYINQSNDPNSNSYDLDYLNHAFTTDNIVSSWDNSEGYVYFPVDDSSNSTKSNNVFVKNDFQLGVFQHTIVKKIFDSIGVKLDGSMFNDPTYYNTLVNLPIDIYSLSNIQSTVKRFAPPYQPLTGQGPSGPTPILFDQQDYDKQWDGTVFTAAYDITTIGFIIQLVTEQDINFASGSLIDYEIWVNGVNEYQDVISPYNTVDKLTFNTIKTYFADGGDFPRLNIGDTVEFRFKGNFNDVTSDINIVKSSTGTGAYSRFDYNMENAVADYDINLAIPEINQATFIKDVMFRHGAISQFNNKTRTLIINKFQDINQNKIKAIDYSEKIDISKNPIFNFTKVLSSFKKKSQIIYKSDDQDNELVLFKDKLGIGLGNAEKEIDNDNLNGEGVVYESVFSATAQGWTFPYPVDSSNSLSNFYLPSMRFAVDSDDLKSLNGRILLKAGKINVSSFNKGGFNDIEFNGIPESEVGYAYFAKQSLNETGLTDTSLNLNLDTLAFDNQQVSITNYIGNTILQKNYRLYFDILKQPVHLSIYLNVTALDIQQLDFFKPIWLDFSLGRGYYYLDNVSQYKGDGTSTKFELVKI